MKHLERKPDSLLMESSPTTLRVARGHDIAYVHRPGKATGLLFCGGFMSDMTGIKALALERHAVAAGRAFTRFDYRGHGASSGRIEEGTLGAWIEDALAVIDRLTE